jgi:hypothetical protein
VICDLNSKDTFPPAVLQSDNQECNQRVQIRSKFGCPILTVNAIWTFFEKTYVLWGIIFIIFGFFLTLFGRKLFKFAIFFLGMAAFVFLSMLFMYATFFDKKTDPVYGWVTLAISIVIGALVGLVLAKLSKIGVAVLAGWGGFSLGLILWSSFLYYINS